MMTTLMTTDWNLGRTLFKSIQTDPYVLLDTAVHNPSPRGSYWTRLVSEKPSIGSFCVPDSQLPHCHAAKTCSASQRLVEAASILDKHIAPLSKSFPSSISQPLFNCPQKAVNHDSMQQQERSCKKCGPRPSADPVLDLLLLTEIENEPSDNPKLLHLFTSSVANMGRLFTIVRAHELNNSMLPMSLVLEVGWRASPCHL